MLPWNSHPAKEVPSSSVRQSSGGDASPPRDATVHSGVGKRHPMRPHPCCGSQARRAQVPSLINSTVYLLRGDIFTLLPTVALLNLIYPLFYKSFMNLLLTNVLYSSVSLSLGVPRRWRALRAPSSGEGLVMEVGPKSMGDGYDTEPGVWI
jgi:hypothetical protein